METTGDHEATMAEEGAVIMEIDEEEDTGKVASEAPVSIENKYSIAISPPKERQTHQAALV